MNTRLSTKTKLALELEEQSEQKNDQTKKKTANKPRLLRIQSGNFVVCKMNNFDNDYDIVGDLGEGAFGKVYKVRHKALKLNRALKKIKKSSPQSKFSNFDQISVLKQLDHINILKIYEFYETDQFYFIITDIFDGKQLFDEIIDSEKLSEQIASRILKQILITLNYTHSQGIAHRDIKPENILVRNIKSKDKFRLKIIDWGLGTLIDNKASNRVCGTPQYAAPQIFKGKYTLQCDMWSLGVLAFIMLTGNMPFKGKKTQETIRMVQKGVINFRKTGFLDLSEEARDFVIKLIQKDPTKRMTSSTALEHPWMKQFNKQKQTPVLLKETLERLKQFNVTNRLGVAVVNFMNNHYSSNDQKQTMEQIFKYLDKNGDGVLSAQELIQGYTQIYGKVLAQKIAEDTFSKLDVNNSGTLQYSEFVAFGLERSQLNQKERLKQAFNLFDKNKNGCINLKQINQILSGKVDELSEDKLKQMMSQFDENGDNEIDFEEFYKFIIGIFSKIEEVKKEEKISNKNE